MPARRKIPWTPRPSCACVTTATRPGVTLLTLPFGESGGIDDFCADGKSLYVETSVGADTARLVRVDIASGKELETIAKDPRADVGGVIIHPDTRLVQAVGLQLPEKRVAHPRSGHQGRLRRPGQDRPRRVLPFGPRPRRQELAHHLSGRRRPRRLVRLQPRQQETGTAFCQPARPGQV